MCFFYNNNYNDYCRRVDYRGVRVIQGPIGPQGMAGPQGATGPAGTNNAIYLGLFGGTVATDTNVALAQITATPTTTMSVTGSAVTIGQSGTYLVNYGFSGNTTESINGTLTLYRNGSAIANESVTQSTDTTVQNARRTSLITLTAGDTIALHNTTTTAINLTDATLLLLKLA